MMSRIGECNRIIEGGWVSGGDWRDVLEDRGVIERSSRCDFVILVPPVSGARLDSVGHQFFR